MHIRLSISRLPNETVLNYSSKERRKLAIQFLPEHPNETIAAACRLYHIKDGTIYQYQRKSRTDHRRTTHSSYNSILSTSQEQAVI